MADDGSSDRRNRQFSLLAIFAVVTLLALCLAVFRLSPKLLFGLFLFAVGLACALWKVRRYRRRGYRELLSEIAHSVLGPSLPLAALMMIVGLGLVISCILTLAR